MRIVFLCSGNTARSPMAEALFGRMVKNADVSSAGFMTLSGEDADEYAVLVCRKHGIDLSGFKTTNISDVDFKEVDVVLTATCENKKKIKKFHPYVNAYTIKEYGGSCGDYDIKDPSDGGLGEYVVCYFEIKQALENILKNHDEFEVIK